MDKYDQVVGWITSYWAGAVLLLVLAVLAALPQVRDGASLLWSWVVKVIGQKKSLFDTEPIVIDTPEERITFTELLRSVHHDVVKVNAHTHVLGVSAEHEWIERRYPQSKVKSQALTSLKRISKRQQKAKPEVHFDVLTLELMDGRNKNIYFDISDFFGGEASSVLDPEGAVAKQLEDLYK